MSTLVFDIGGTKTRFAVVREGKLGRVVTFPTPKNWRDVEPTFRREATRLLAGRKVMMAIGGVPGTLDPRKEILIRASNLRGWDKTPISKTLKRVFSVARIRIENDANLAGLGEAVYGAGKGNQIVAYLGIGTGVGGTRIVNGRLDEAASGFRPGHQIIDRSSKARCGCGQRGDLESLISGSGLARQFHQPAEKLPTKIFSQAALLLGTGLNNISVLWTPNVIVLGGSVMLRLWPFRRLISKGLAHRSYPPKLLQAKLGDLSGLYGALALSK